VILERETIKFRAGTQSFLTGEHATEAPALPHLRNRERFLLSSAIVRTSPQVLFRAPLLAGEAGTEQTITVMRELVDQAAADPGFVRRAVDILRSVPAFDELGETEALFEWVRRNIRFTKDPLTKEKLYPPQELLKIRAGDCDDISMLLGALLIAVGYPARLVTVSANRNHPQEFSHVYVEAEVPAGSGRWIAMDPARPGSAFGDEPPVYFRKRAWSLTEDSAHDLRGLGSYGTVGELAEFGDVGDSNIDWNDIWQQSIQMVPAIISTARGGGSSVSTSGGSTQTSPPNPYGSFMTPYTPGYGIPPAGYSSSGYIAGGSSSILPWIIGGGLLLFFLKGRR
jgi:hypothetical protein